MPSVETMEVLQVVSELEPMVALYRKRKPLKVLEIGCWDGGTLRVWLKYAKPGATIVAVDLEHRNSDAYEGWRKPHTELHAYTGPSQAAEQVEAIRSHAPYDWVFIDGDHGDYGVRTDVATCLHLVRLGGLMLLHDIEAPAGYGSVYPPGQVLEELAAQHYPTWTYVDPKPEPWAHGIGVVQL